MKTHKSQKSWRSVEDVRNLASAWVQARSNRDAAIQCMTLVGGALEDALRSDPATFDRLKQFDPGIARDVMRATIWRGMTLREVCTRLKALGLPPWKTGEKEATTNPLAVVEP